MSDNISVFNRSIPKFIQFYEMSVPSFTVAAGAAASPYEITGSRASISLSSAKNVTKANATDNEIITLCWAHVSALITSTTTDVTSLEIQHSVNNGASWTSIANPFATLTPASANKSVTQGNGNVNLNIELAGAATGDAVLFRTVIFDATSPTTDALTITNIRAGVAMLVMS